MGPVSTHFLGPIHRSHRDRGRTARFVAQSQMFICPYAPQLSNMFDIHSPMLGYGNPVTTNKKDVVYFYRDYTARVSTISYFWDFSFSVQNTQVQVMTLIVFHICFFRGGHARSREYL